MLLLIKGQLCCIKIWALFAFESHFLAIEYDILFFLKCRMDKHNEILLNKTTL